MELKFAELQKDYADLHAAIFEAAQVHRRLCAPRQLRFGDYEIASEIFAVRHLPGDFFTAEQTTDGVVMALGDICGKGLAAGMWTTHVVGMLRAHTARTSAPEQIVAGVNRDICRMSTLRPLASLFLAKLNVETGELSYCSAGHPPAFLLRANGEFASLTDGGLLLGVLDDAEYCSGRLKLEPRDTLLVFSDGILESQNASGEEFGYDRLKAELAKAVSTSADAILFSVLGAVQDFATIRPLMDDMTLAVIRRD
ncbi:MAG TPA: PP2C family protein-serine/threonine phosphatase [Pyrinomonadaceae bacterium]|nr:PP2C family protein-serine/threonine phosphatase [Pyrinomonadaceae bacterium]